MWFAFGIVTLLAALVASLAMRRQARWRGTPAVFEGRAYECLLTRGKKPLLAEDAPIISLTIGLSGAPRSMHFRLLPEGSYGRIAKRLGITAEYDFDDPQFDTRIHLESDDPRVADALRDSAQLRSALAGLFCLQQAFSVRRITCREGRLWCEIKPADANVDPSAQAVARVVPVLSKFMEELNERADFASQRLRDPFVWRAILILSISSASIIGGGILTLRATLGRTDILDPWSLFWLSALAAVPLLLLFVLATLRLLGRSARAHLVLLEVILVGTPGFILSTNALAREANISFDSSAPKVLRIDDAKAVQVTRRGRRGGTHQYYFLTAPKLPEALGDDRRIEISRDSWLAINVSDTAWVTVREGALGFQWVERVDAGAPP